MEIEQLLLRVLAGFVYGTAMTGILIIAVILSGAIFKYIRG